MGLGKQLKKVFGGKKKPAKNGGPAPQEGLGGLGGNAHGLGMMGAAQEAHYQVDNPMLAMAMGAHRAPPQPQAPANAQPSTVKRKKAKELLRDRHVKSRKGGAGGGSANDVQRVSYNREIGSSGSTEGFFKADWNHKKMNKGRDEDNQLNMPGTGYTVGIKDEDARNGSRAVASARVDALLGTNVVSQDRFARHGGQDGIVSPMVAGEAFASNVYGTENLADISRKGQANVPYRSIESAKNFNASMAGGAFKVEGDKVFAREGIDSREIDGTNGNLQQGLANLQLNDFLTGQVDRHEQNIFSDAQGNVTGIDNDLAFGSSYKANMAENGAGQHNMGMPTFIDGGIAEYLQAMDESQFRAAISGQKGDLNYLNDSEIDSAVGRFNQIKAYVEELLADPTQPDERLIYDWGGAELRDKMVADGKNYLARHLQTE